MRTTVGAFMDGALGSLQSNVTPLVNLNTTLLAVILVTLAMIVFVAVGKCFYPPATPVTAAAAVAFASRRPASVVHSAVRFAPLVLLLPMLHCPQQHIVPGIGFTESATERTY